MSVSSLDPEPSASANSATRPERDEYNIAFRGSRSAVTWVAGIARLRWCDSSSEHPPPGSAHYAGARAPGCAERRSPAAADAILAAWPTPPLYDRYRIVRKLGSGAFATVYLADDEKLGRPVAVKVVTQAADVEGRVLREAQAAAKLSHHHILAVYEIVQEPDRTLLITEYIQGQTLRECYQDRRLTDADILEVGVQLCRALEHAHKRGVVHRDIKPENIMLVDGDAIDIRLMDFGVARLEDRASITVDGDLVGTLAYMSPEQGEGKTVDSRTDVYSLALTLYEGFTGKNPFRGKKLQELLRDVSRPDIPPLSVGRPDLRRKSQRRLGPGHGSRPLLSARRRDVRTAARAGGQNHAAAIGVRDRRHPHQAPAPLTSPDRERWPSWASTSRLGRSRCARSSTCCRGPRSTRRRPSCPWWPCPRSSPSSGRSPAGC